MELPLVITKLHVMVQRGVTGKRVVPNVQPISCIEVVDAFSHFNRIMAEVRKTYRPSIVVLQCGADTLVGDPMNSFNLTLKGIGNCVDLVLRWRLPTLLLGGGQCA